MAVPPPEFLAALLEELTRALESRGIPFMLIGGQAVLLHGQPRFTEDIDATLGVGPEGLPVVLEACQAIGLEPLPEDVSAFVAETFVLPSRHLASGVRVDLIFSTLPYEAEAIRRAVRVRVGATEVPFATAEDLLIHKLFAGRPRDIEDAIGVIRRNETSLDWTYVTRWIAAFADVPGRERLSELLDQVRRRATEG